MKKTVSIGEQDFKRIIEQKAYYVDKTGFIKEWWDNLDKVTLIARPRRFGKTLNMSMVNYFFSNKYANGETLFDGLTISKDKKMMAL